MRQYTRRQINEPLSISSSNLKRMIATRLRQSSIALIYTTKLCALLEEVRAANLTH